MKSILLSMTLVVSTLTFGQTVEVKPTIQTLWKTANPGAPYFELDKYGEMYYLSFHNFQYQYISDRGTIPFRSLEECLKYFTAVETMFNTSLEGQDLVVKGELEGITWEVTSRMGSMGRSNYLWMGNKFAPLRPAQLKSLLSYLRENSIASN